MADPLLEVRGLNKHFGGIVATDNLDLDVAAGEIHALIGPNGAGKTTLVAQLSGEVQSDSGTIRFDGADITRLPPHACAGLGLARSFQITSVFYELTALDNVALAVQAHDGHSFRFWHNAAADQRLRRPAAEVLERVGLAERAEVITRDMSHGEHRQLEIAMALVAEPKMLLLDEPMAGMGGEESERMIGLLTALKGQNTVLLVEHDMDTVFALADRITVLVYGRAIATGAPADIRANALVREAYLGEEES